MRSWLSADDREDPDNQQLHTTGRNDRCWHLFFFQAEDGIRDYKVTGVQTCALPISRQLSSRIQPSSRLSAAMADWAVDWSLPPMVAILHTRVPAGSSVPPRKSTDVRQIGRASCRERV